MAAELLLPDAQGGLGQGTVQLKRISIVPIDPAQPWLGNKETEQTWSLRATVKRVNHRNINGVLISETGDEVIFADPGTVPLLSDTLVIDGVNRAIFELRPIPGAGVIVAWKAWSKA